MADFVRLATIHDLPDGGMRAVEYNGRRIALFRAGETIYATDDICSHDYAELSEGFFDPDDCTVECPLHGSRFDVRTGRALTLPAFAPIEVFEVQRQGDDLLVRVP